MTGNVDVRILKECIQNETGIPRKGNCQMKSVAKIL